MNIPEIHITLEQSRQAEVGFTLLSKLYRKKRAKINRKAVVENPDISLEEKANYKLQNPSEIDALSVEQIRAFRKIESATQIFIPTQSTRNLRNLRLEVFSKGLSEAEMSLFNLICQWEFTLSHGTYPSAISKIQNSEEIWSYSRCLSMGVIKSGLTCQLDRSLGNTDMVYGVLNPDNKQVRFPDLLGGYRNVIICKMQSVRERTFPSGRLSDWYWYQSDRELTPVLLGTTLRRVVHTKEGNKRYKIYIYEHPNGQSDRFKVRMGQEEFFDSAITPGIALSMIKELRMVEKENPESFAELMSPFSSEVPFEIQNNAALTLFRRLYSLEVSVPCQLRIGLENKDYRIEEGFLKKKSEVECLHFAIQEDNLWMVQQVIEGNESLVDASNNNKTPLMRAILKKNTEIASYLISKNADLDLKDEKKMTALMYAILEQQPQIVKLILDKDPSSVNGLVSPEGDLCEHRWKRYQTPLMLATSIQNQEIIDILMAAGARPRLEHLVIAIPHFVKDGTRYFLLGRKCYKDRQILRAYGDYVLPGCLMNLSDDTPIEAALNNLKFLAGINAKKLFNQGLVSASVAYTYQKETKDRSKVYHVDYVLIDLSETAKNSPVSLSTTSSSHLMQLAWFSKDYMEEMPDTVLAKRYRLNGLNGKKVIRGSNALLMEMIHTSSPISSENMDFLIDLELDGANRLHQAILNKNYREIKFLLENHVYVESRVCKYDSSGYKGRQSALVEAILANDAKAVKLLMQFGARVNTKIGGETILNHLTNENKFHLIKAILKYSHHYMDVPRFSELSRQTELMGLFFKYFKNLHHLFFLGEAYYASFLLRPENNTLLDTLLGRKPQDTTEIPSVFLLLANGAIAKDDEGLLTRILPHLDNINRGYDFRSRSLRINMGSLEPTTLLHEACKKNATRCALLLIKSGAGEEIKKDSQGKTYLDYVIVYDNQEILEALKETVRP